MSADRLILTEYKDICFTAVTSLYSSGSFPAVIRPEHFPVVHPEPFQVPRRASLSAPFLLLLALDILLHLLLSLTVTTQ